MSIKIEYNIKSRGTERNYYSDGYIAISEIVGKKRYILPISHSISEIATLPSNCLWTKANVNIYKVAMARFSLISMLFLNKRKLPKSAKILVIGCGCVGFGLLFNLKYLKYKYVTYSSRHKGVFKDFVWKRIDNVMWEEYDIIIDATGENDIIETAVEKCEKHAIIVLLGTPRNNPQISMLMVHRKNLSILGAHELNGYTNHQRQTIFNKTLRMVNRINFDFSSVCEIVFNFSRKGNKIYQIRRNYDF